MSLLPPDISLFSTSELPPLFFTFSVAFVTAGCVWIRSVNKKEGFNSAICFHIRGCGLRGFYLGFYISSVWRVIFSGSHWRSFTGESLSVSFRDTFSTYAVQWSQQTWSGNCLASALFILLIQTSVLKHFLTQWVVVSTWRQEAFFFCLDYISAANHSYLKDNDRKRYIVNMIYISERFFFFCPMVPTLHIFTCCLKPLSDKAWLYQCLSWQSFT